MCIVWSYFQKKNNYIKNLFDKALKGDYVWLGEDPNPSGNFCEFDEFFVIKLSNPGGNFSQSKEELWFSTQNRFVFSIAVFVCHESVNKENKMLIFLFILLIFVHMNFFNINIDVVIDLVFYLFFKLLYIEIFNLTSALKVNMPLRILNLQKKRIRVVVLLRTDWKKKTRWELSLIPLVVYFKSLSCYFDYIYLLNCVLWRWSLLVVTCNGQEFFTASMQL